MDHDSLKLPGMGPPLISYRVPSCILRAERPENSHHFKNIIAFEIMKLFWPVLPFPEGAVEKVGIFHQSN